MTSPDRFAGKVALVTGAGGSIGSAVARRLAAEGARLTLLDRDATALHKIREELQSTGGVVVAVEVDQTNREQVELAVDATLGEHGGLDLVFANAGYGKLRPFLEMPVNEWNRAIDVNLTGTFHVLQIVARAMVDRGRGGSIVLNASSGAAQYSDQLAAYCASKAGVRMLATAMASELGGHDVRVNSIMPGVIESNMTRPALAGEPKHREVLLADTPVGRLGQPDDIASLVTFLLSDEANFITGHAVMIDGGQTIHGHPRWYRLDYRDRAAAEWYVG